MSASGGRQRQWARERPTWPHHEASSFVDAGGIRWHVQRAGEGPRMLLIHGTGASSHSWRDLLPILGSRYSILVPDLPGHGFTDSVAAARRSIRGMSEAMSALLGTLGFDPAFVVGHSAGAVILARMALDRRIDPRVIISVNGAFLPWAPALQWVFSPIAKLLADSSLLHRWLAKQADSPAGVKRILAATGSRLGPSGVDLYWRLVRDPAHLAGALGMMGSWDLGSFVRELPRLSTPLALLVGDNDRTVPPRQALDVQQRVPRAKVISLPGLGHLAHEEAPALVAQTIIAECHSQGISP